MRPLILLSCLFAQVAAAAAQEIEWDRSVVTLEVNRTHYDYIQPWSRRVEQVQKMGTVLEDKQILTTADQVADHTLIRVQKGGRGKWWRGELDWVDYHANLAVVRVPEDSFWDGLKGLELSSDTPNSGNVQLLRWRTGNFDNRRLEINRWVVRPSKLSFLEHLQLEVDSEISGTGWAEPIIDGKKVVGITASKEEHTCTVIPAEFIRGCLQARDKRTYRPLGFFAFVWQRAANPATLEYLGLKGEPRGVIIIDIPPGPEQAAVFKKHDIILEVDGFTIDTQGDYKDPDHGNLSLENLATRNKRAGEKVKFKVWRDGESKELEYTLPAADYSIELVPRAHWDQPPQYVLMGGLLFQPLTEPYLQSWGADWIRKAPFRLGYYTREKKSAERPSLVMLSLVLPDPHNLGYQDARFLVLDKLNGKPIRFLPDLIEARRNPVNGFHIFQFHEGDTLKKIVLDAAETEKATARILERYGIENEFLVTAKEPLSAGVK